MGSASDREKMAPAVQTLEEFGLEADERVLSAHRTPDKVAEFARQARDEGYAAIICGAGMAAHLAAAAAVDTTPMAALRPKPKRRLGDRVPDFTPAATKAQGMQRGAECGP